MTMESYKQDGAKEKQIPNENELLENLNKISFTLDKAYLGRLDDSRPLPYEENFLAIKDENGKQKNSISDKENIRVLRVDRWVYDKGESIIECFQNVLSVFADSDVTLALALHRTPKQVEAYFIVQNVGEGRNQESTDNLSLLEKSILGNFPGSSLHPVKAADTAETMNRIFNFYNDNNNGYKAITALANVPSEKSKDYLSQGIDKLLNGIVPANDEDDYVVVFLARALDQDGVREILSGYQELATALAPYAGYQFQMGKNQTTSNSEMTSLTHTKGISQSITKTHSVNLGGFISTGTSISGGGGLNIGPLGGNASATKGVNSGLSAGYGYSVARGESESEGEAKTTGATKTISLGTADSTTYTYKSYEVNGLIQKLETSIDRIQRSRAFGLWSSAAYVLSRNMNQCKNVANFIRALSQGNDSFIEGAYIQEWPYRGRGSEVTAFGEAKKYLRHLVHPIFVFGTSAKDAIAVTPTVDVSTAELARVFAFPNHSIPGLPVIDCARFGREPHPMIQTNSTVDLGCTYHMRTPGKGRVALDREMLTAHTFITGSTGSGKSTTIYNMLDELCLKKGAKTKFLVIEPAKGEYKDIFGGLPAVAVYGTNPKKTPLLKLNPFSFPEEIHVLEHIDRLVEIFNACWPMYAAMPAVLKASVETAYIRCGWNMSESVCYGARRFPTFRDVMDALPDVVDQKGFSKDTQGDYKGSLLTRLESLTNGINGQVLCAYNELSSHTLFDNNVIVDLSLVGSPETKALLMGILILKLQEHRMYQRATGEIKSNSLLRHITVLEEAHNLLRRTSMDQSQESSNLQGKSVEMLTNAIAEMRTYGEGFIIADQAPGLLDMAVIRNTNTKIILRLPDESDRLLVGKAAGLNDDQITELSRLDTLVAAVYQNHWLEPVLCSVDLYKKGKPYVYKPSAPPVDQLSETVYKVLLDGIVDGAWREQEGVDRIKTWIDRRPVFPLDQQLLHDILLGDKQATREERDRLLYSLSHGNDLIYDLHLNEYTPAKPVAATVDGRLMQDLRISQETALQLRQVIFAQAQHYAMNEWTREKFAEIGGVR